MRNKHTIYNENNSTGTRERWERFLVVSFSYLILIDFKFHLLVLQLQ